MATTYRELRFDEKKAYQEMDELEALRSLRKHLRSRLSWGRVRQRERWEAYLRAVEMAIGRLESGRWI